MNSITDLTTGKIYFYYDDADRAEIIAAIESSSTVSDNISDLLFLMDREVIQQ